MNRIFVVCMVLILWALSPAQAQSNESPLDYNRFSEPTGMQSGLQQEVIQSLSDDLEKQFGEAWVEYNRRSMKHRLTSLWTQYALSLLIFILVVAIVSFGIAMSYKQFSKSEKDADKTTTIKFGQYGVEVSTSITGVVVLLISLIFFYLYLAVVFPIREIAVGG